MIDREQRNFKYAKLSCVNDERERLIDLLVMLQNERAKLLKEMEGFHSEG